MVDPRNAPPVNGNAAGAGTAGTDAEKAAFLRDLRALRDQAGLGTRDLAARAHFPEDTLTTAEAGPALPSLPVLQAYVRGCGASDAEWEDRWRRLNASGASEGPALPTRAPSASRPAARVMPFGEPGAGHSAAEQDAIGFGLARVARGLAPLSPDPAPAQPGMGTRGPAGGAPPVTGGTDRSAEIGNSGMGSGGWFEPAAKASAPPSPPAAPTFTSPPTAPLAPPPPPARPAPRVNPGATAMDYPATGYPAPERSYSPPPSYPASPARPVPSYRLPEEFRTPVAAPPSAPPAREAAAGQPGSRPVPPTSASPAPHAAPASPRRHTATWAMTALVVLAVIAAVLWLVLGH